MIPIIWQSIFTYQMYILRSLHLLGHLMSSWINFIFAFIDFVIHVLLYFERWLQLFLFFVEFSLFVEYDFQLFLDNRSLPLISRKAFINENNYWVVVSEAERKVILPQQCWYRHLIPEFKLFQENCFLQLYNFQSDHYLRQTFDQILFQDHLKFFHK